MAELMETIEFIGVSPNDPTIRGMNLPSGEVAFLQPTVERSWGHIEGMSEIGEPPLMRLELVFGKLNGTGKGDIEQPT